MKVKSFEGMVCSIAGALEWTGDRWTMLILRDLFIGLRRFDEFRESTGIPPTTLSDRLKRLVEAGMVKKRAYQQGPARYEFVLTRKGRDFWRVLLAIAHWGDEYDASGHVDPPMRFIDEKTGEDVELKLAPRADGSIIDPGDIKIVAGDSADDKIFWRLDTAKR